MNENIDLTEILKDCPIGTKLYHVGYGDVWFCGIDLGFNDPIRLSLSKSAFNDTGVTSKGMINQFYNGECLLFPSKDQRDWSKFIAPWYKKEKLVELKESDDEKIRRWIIDDIRYNMNNEPLNNSEYKKKAEKAIAWLEKQRDKNKLIQELGEYKVKYTQEVLEKHINSISNKDDERLRKITITFLKDFAEQGYENAVECIDWLEKQGKNPTNKPRFKVGDWVIFIKSKGVYQVEKKENYEYTLRHILGGSLCLSFSNEELIREWTIQDAKDGDILACNEEILLFKSYLAQERISLYCWYNGQTNNFHSKEVVNILMSKINKIHPATKEQRDLLFQKIKEAGYKWNAETKTLEKLEGQL